MIGRIEPYRRAHEKQVEIVPIHRGIRSQVQSGSRLWRFAVASAEKLKFPGIDLARRTVAKYRKILNIPTARQRREF